MSLGQPRLRRIWTNASGAWRCWDRPSGSPAGTDHDQPAVSARARADRTLAIWFVTVRAFFLVQTAVGLSVRSVLFSPLPVPLGCLCGVALVSVAVGARLIRRGATAGCQRLLLLDAVSILLPMIIIIDGTPVEDRLTPWSNGLFTVSMSSALLAGFCLRTLSGALLAGGALAACYLSAILSGPASLPSPWELLPAEAAVNACAYLEHAGVGWALAWFVRRLADRADTARSRIRELERNRTRATVHDLLPYLHLCPEGLAQADEMTRTALIRQRAAKYRQIQSFVDDAGSTPDLDTSLSEVVGLHRRLRIESASGLPRGTRCDRDGLERLLRAVDTVLANIEQHAPDANVTVRTRGDPETIVATVHDDGPGFDPARTRFGYGLTQILGHHLGEIGGHATVRSGRGHGTEVTIRVPRRLP
ncbi:MAG: hypothetical protein HKP61_19760 [Dactylosporangium sp.]|nr:hypothetical protein [Dactylosporangium sp.]NNJ63124.1 hypothetical protein [Dactylosporangium sp.]